MIYVSHGSRESHANTCDCVDYSCSSCIFYSSYSSSFVSLIFPVVTHLTLDQAIPNGTILPIEIFYGFVFGLYSFSVTFSYY